VLHPSGCLKDSLRGVRGRGLGGIGDRRRIDYSRSYDRTRILENLGRAERVTGEGWWRSGLGTFADVRSRPDLAFIPSVTLVSRSQVTHQAG
jgi:hypothetical protein